MPDRTRGYAEGAPALDRSPPDEGEVAEVLGVLVALSAGAAVALGAVGRAVAVVVGAVRRTGLLMAVVCWVNVGVVGLLLLVLVGVAAVVVGRRRVGVDVRHDLDLVVAMGEVG